MRCPHCEKTVPDHTAVCVWCGKSLTDTRCTPKKRRLWLIVAAVTAAAAILAVTLCAVLLAKPSKEALIGTWQATLPVGQAVSLMLGEEGEEMGLFGQLFEQAGADLTVTVYCRFYEDDTYSIYAGHEELLAAVETAVDVVIDYACGDGLFAVLEAQGISRVQAELFFAMGNVSLDSVSDAVSQQVDDLLMPVYRMMEKALEPSADGTGERTYLLEGERLYMALEKGKDIADSVYAVCRFDGDTLTFSTGTILDEYIGDLVWIKTAA